MRDPISILELSGAAVLAFGGFLGLYAKGSEGAALVALLAASLTFMAFVVRNEHLFGAANSYRRFFQNGGGMARVLVIVMTVGGTVLLMDLAYHINFILLEWLDPLFKRLAPAMVIDTMVLYAASIVSNVVYRASEVGKDGQIRGYEFFFYLSATILIVAVTVLELGSPVEIWLDKVMPPHANSMDWRSFRWPAPPRQDGYEYPAIGPVYKGFVVTICIAGVWAIGTFLCVVSRGTEWMFKEGAPIRPAPQRNTGESAKGHPAQAIAAKRTKPEDEPRATKTIATDQLKKPHDRRSSTIQSST